MTRRLVSYAALLLASALIISVASCGVRDDGLGRLYEGVKRVENR